MAASSRLRLSCDFHFGIVRCSTVVYRRVRTLLVYKLIRGISTGACSHEEEEEEEYPGERSTYELLQTQTTSRDMGSTYGRPYHLRPVPPLPRPDGLLYLEQTALNVSPSVVRNS